MNDNQLMYFNEQTDIYWHGTFMGVAVLLGGLLMWVFARRIRKGAASTLKFIYLVGYPLAVICARLEYCWFRQDDFTGGMADILDFNKGGFAFMGAMLAMAAVIAVAAALSKRFTAAELFDAASPAAAAALCIGRMASHFSNEELGFELYTDFFRRVMFTTYNAADGKTFVMVYPYEAIAAAVIFIVCIWTFDSVYSRHKFVPGTVFVRFLLGFTLSQMLLESWRSDSLYMVSLGFVRFNQAFCAVVLAVVLVVLCVRYAKSVGYSSKQIGIWVALLLGIALAFVCEFFMTGGSRLRNYIGMGAGLAVVAVTAHALVSKGMRQRADTGAAL